MSNSDHRGLTSAEIAELQQRGCSAESWALVRVCEEFSPSQLRGAHFEGYVYIGEGVLVINSTVKNYLLRSGARVESVTRLECRTKSSFGCGVSVATINECGGRSVKIYDSLTAQIAYVWAMFRHRGQFCGVLDSMVEEYAAAKSSEVGVVGEGAQIVGVKFIREVNVGAGVTIEGASLLENGTLCEGAYVGVDVKACDFIAAESSRIDTGATIERCFVGESAIVASGFSAVDSLIFANSHLEKGEAASIFAAPYTVSHHKSSLLIAGLFSFFNAGSGSNQSNHLFKTGAVHQAIHPRGCKFASGAYIMAPAVEGAYTMVKGSHTKHHDTLAFPFSYLVADGERSVLMPGANLTSYGTYRDIDKWAKRDRRVVRRDVINFEEHNPYITSMMIKAVNTIHTLQEESPSAEEYMWNRVAIKSAHLRRGLGFYNKAIVSALGAMLECGASTGDFDGTGEWIDAAGGYITQRAVESLISAVEGGSISTLEGCQDIFGEFSQNYSSYAYNYAISLLGQLLGHTPTTTDIEDAIASAQSSRAALQKMRESDGAKDCGVSMAVGYGLHTASKEDMMADYEAVRGL